MNRKEYYKQYAEKNKEKRKEYNKIWRENGGKEYLRNYHKQNKNKLKKQKEEWLKTEKGIKFLKRQKSKLKNLSLEDRFLQKVLKTENCWEWIGSKIPNGYGKIMVKIEKKKYKYQYAHRVSYEIYIGKINNNLCVLHRCDNPSCVKPEHLFLGTQKDNMEDRERKNRGRYSKKEKIML